MNKRERLPNATMLNFQESTLRTLLGRRVTSLRKQQALSIASIARDAGIAMDRCAAIESGSVDPFLGEIISLAKCLKVPIAEFISGITEDKK